MAFHEHECNIVAPRAELRPHGRLAWRYAIPIGQVEHSSGKEHTSSGECDTAWPNPRLVIRPAPHKGYCIDRAVQPCAIFKIMVEQRIDNGERRHQPHEVMVLLIASQ